MMKIISQIEGNVRRISHALQIIFGFGRTSAPVDDSGVIRQVQSIYGAGQVSDLVPYVQHYGFASNPPVGADLVYGAVNGNRSVATIIATNHQAYGIKNMGDGVVALYDMFGNTLILSSSGITITSGTVTINGNLHVTGAIIAGQGGSDSVSLQTHQHVNGGGTGNSGSPAAGT